MPSAGVRWLLLILQVFESGISIAPRDSAESLRELRSTHLLFPEGLGS
jgi:hypothetical protein